MNYFSEIDNCIGFSEQEIEDFKNFDGNVQTFRILRKLQFFKDEHSFNLTFPSLASIIKYPYSSIEGNKGKNEIHVGLKKFGFFASEEADYKILSETLKIENKRHPITYLLEAADDIAFSAADIEDGVKLGLVSVEKIRQVFKDNLNKNADLLDEFDALFEKFKGFENERSFLTVQNFRVNTQGRMIQAIIQSFKDNYDSIMDGSYPFELIDKSEASDIRKSFKKIQTIIFDNKKIMQTELAGWEVLYGILDIFIDASKSEYFKSEGNNKEARLYKLISSSFRYIYENYNNNDDVSEQYKKFQLVVDFIAGMTDSFALDLFQKLKGIKL